MPEVGLLGTVERVWRAEEGVVKGPHRLELRQGAAVVFRMVRWLL